MAFMASHSISAATFDLTLNVSRPGAAIQPTMYGLFFEDINFAADGGLYAEKVINRSFEFPQNLEGWTTFGGVELLDDGPFDRNPHYVRISSSNHKDKYSGLENRGFIGIGVKKGEPYRFSVWARAVAGKEVDLDIVLADKSASEESQNIAKAKIKVDSPEWKKYSVQISPSKTISHAVLRIFLAHPDSNAVVDLEHISLFPVDTWNGHENGLRKDLAQKLADLHPGVFRFPGGCIVEGTDIATRYQWKNTIGPVENRPTNENRWHYTFPHRFFPEYYQSNGLGFFEYFQLAEEIGAEPLPVVSVGLACQFQNKTQEAHVPVDSLTPYIQDVLDLIEFANGNPSTGWGAIRAQMGHPEPFNLKFIALGNEQWGPEYIEHLEPFLTPIREAYPDIKIIGSSGPDSEGKQFEYLWPEMKRLKADLVDEHFYRPEDWFLSQGTRYDNYDRKGPKVFAGEYACHIRGKKYNQFRAALLEAAFMTGMERNADVVYMATYAPLFAHVDGWQWRPDMIWFDNLSSIPTSSYYVQQLFAGNKGSNVLPLTLTDGKPLAGMEGQNGLFASAVLDQEAGEIILKIVNTSDESQEVNVNIKGLKKGQQLNGGKVLTLRAEPDDENTIDNPDKVMPTMAEIHATGNQLLTVVAPTTFVVYRLPI